MIPKIPSKAYLVAKFDLTGILPMVVDFRIVSTSAQGLSTIGGELYADIFSLEADTFGEASEKVRKLAHEIWPCLDKFLDTSFESHMERYYLYQYINNLRAIMFASTQMKV